ncbi:MAG: hypothetical protein J3Q66DRAFT_322400 [Benniella sp.]|nr:MAG: hypothetical protein J3Q66DRAFT_322400 [Benniella sp.]
MESQRRHLSHTLSVAFTAIVGEVSATTTNILTDPGQRCQREAFVSLHGSVLSQRVHMTQSNSVAPTRRKSI